MEFPLLLEEPLLIRQGLTTSHLSLRLLYLLYLLQQYNGILHAEDGLAHRRTLLPVL